MITSRRLLASLLAIALSGLFAPATTAATTAASAPPATVRIATFNASLNREVQGQLVRDLADGANAQARKIAEILQRVRPDIVLLNEFDYDAGGTAARLFHDHYLAVSQSGQAALQYPYSYAPPVNTGVTPNTSDARHDFDRDGVAAHTAPPPGAPFRERQRFGGDAFGFGVFPGQYGFVIYSRFPIQRDAIRTFQMFRWRDMPGALLPPDWYTPADLEIFRLSSKNHVDVPIEPAPGMVVHVLASHPTPPVFDGPEDRNGRRNHDEIRLWADYLKGAEYVYDDRRQRGGLPPNARFVILGDLNADPFDGDSHQQAARQLLEHPRVNATRVPASRGGIEQAKRQAGVNATHRGDPAHDTGDFSDTGRFASGNLRIDYVLPSKSGWTVQDAGVFWPETEAPEHALVSASDHRLVWMDLSPTPLDR